MAESKAREGESALEFIMKKIARLGDWRANTLARMRKHIKEAGPDVVGAFDREFMDVNKSFHLFLLAAATVLFTSCSDVGMEASEAGDRMRIVDTSVQPVPLLKIYAERLIRTTDGTIYIKNDRHEVLKISPDGKLDRLALTVYGLTRDGRGRAYASIDSGVVEILPDGSTRLLAGEQHTDPDHTNLREDIDGPAKTARFRRLSLNDIGSDSKGNIYVWTSALPSASVRKLDTKGRVSSIIPLTRIANDANNFGNGNFAADNDGAVYFGGNSSIIKIDKRNSVSTLAGVEGAGMGSVREGTGAAARLPRIYEMMIDGHGNLYVQTGSLMWKVTSGGHATLVLSRTCQGVAILEAEAKGCTMGLVDGSAARQMLRFDAFDVDDVGNLYYADSSINAVRKLTPEGILSTIIRGPFPERP